MQQLSWKNFPVKIEKSLCKLYSPKYIQNPVHNSVTIYLVKALSVFLCVKGASPPRRRVTFFCCQKKVTKENHLDLRSKDPLARYGAYKFSGAYSRIACSGERCRFRGLLVPLATLPLIRCEGRSWCAGRMGDYQIAPKLPGGRLWEVRPRARGYICECSVKMPLRNRQFS